MSNFSQNSTIGGLNTLLIGIPSAGFYQVSGKLTLPSLANGDVADSQVVVTISQTPNLGSPTVIYTSLAGSEGFQIMVPCAALDVLTIAMSSSATVDHQLNAVRTTISCG